MCSDLSSLVDNLSEIKDHRKCLDKKTIKDLIREFPNTYNFCKGNICNVIAKRCLSQWIYG